MATTTERSTTMEGPGNVTARNHAAVAHTPIYNVSVPHAPIANVTATNSSSGSEVGEETLPGILLTPVPIKESAELPWETETNTVNLAVLPSLALIAFIIAVCLRSCTWCKEDRRARRNASGAEEDLGFEILTAGDRGFLELDIRSDTTSMYDTVSSYASVLRRNSNLYYDSVNSIRGLGRHRDDSITSYRSLLLQQLDNRRDSVSSYRAFLQKIRECRNESVQVELISDGVDAYPPKKKSMHARPPSLSNGAPPRASVATATSNGTKPRTFSTSTSTEPLLAETPSGGDPMVVAPKDAPSPCQEDKGGAQVERGAPSLRREHRFKVSFVPDDQLNRGRSKPVIPSSSFVDVVVRPPSPDFRVTGAETSALTSSSKRTRHNSLSAPLPTYCSVMEEVGVGAVGAAEWQRGGSERRKLKKRPQSASPSKEAMLMQRRSALPDGDGEEGGMRNIEGGTHPSPCPSPSGHPSPSTHPPSARASPRPGSPERKPTRARSVDRK